MDPLRKVEAVLFASVRPMAIETIALRVGLGLEATEAAVLDLSAAFAGRGVGVVSTAGGWAVRSALDASAPSTSRRAAPTFGRAALETLAAIAVCGPVTRSEIEKARGVSLSKATLDQLLWADLVRPAGRRNEKGAMTFAVTDGFASTFDLSSIADITGMLDEEALRALDLSQAGLPDHLTAEDAEDA